MGRINFIVTNTEVIDYIKDAIIKSKLLPGQRIIEATLCKELGEGRSRVREALRYLAQEDFIQIIKHKGAIVKELSQKEIVQNYDIMGVLEGLAARIAVQTITDDEINEIESIIKDLEDHKEDRLKIFEYNANFHTLLTNLSKNDRLISILDSIYSLTRRSTLQSFYNQEQIRATIKEHREIFDAIKNREPIKVEALIREHYLSAKNRLLKTLNRTL